MHAFVNSSHRLNYSHVRDQPINTPMLAPDFGTLMQSALTVFEADNVRAGRYLRDLMARDAGAFRKHACTALRGGASPASSKCLMGMLAGNGMLLDIMLDPAVLTIGDIARLLRRAPDLAGWIAERICDRIGPEPQKLDPPIATRILRIASAFEHPEPMVRAVARLSEHPCEWVRARAEFALHRANGDVHWIEAKRADRDPRVRANSVEALWCLTSTPVKMAFRRATFDTNNRVVGNAAVGLDLAGQADEAVEITRRMAIRPEPAFRLTAAWVIEELGAERFAVDLDGLRQDPNPKVRARAMASSARLEFIG